ncbi:MAG: hypothetical protein OEV00_00025 [Acidobacteriota bacterium]|nr:hypothetical protein [Acidobacteriota bacterium]MDH3783690.1 hypothetical protein [Acidobacteriota bacterium]
MTSSVHDRRRWDGRRAILLSLALFAVMAGSSLDVSACQAFGGVIDGFVDPIPPSQVQIDGNCTIRNFPASNPLTTNFSFFTQPGQTQERWLIVFDNVVHTGQMSCNSVLGHKIWFTNGSSTTIQEDCQNLLIPVEKIEKDNPPGPPVVSVGVPFTWTLTIPVLFDPATETVIQLDGSPNDLHGITVVDDLNETGVDLTYLGHVAYWLDDNTPVPLTFSNVGGVLTFDNIPIVDAGRQFVVELTVVLEDTPTNASGTQFVNTARWSFGRLIEGIFYEPLPGEWGISEPLTIAAPELVVTKTGPATMNLAEWGEFVLDVHNAGLSEAWDTTLRDLLPDGPTGGMCDLAPEILSARVFAADGVTPVPGKGPLVEGADYTVTWAGAPTCRLEIVTTTANASIEADERMVIRYRTQLDGDTQDGVPLTNVAGAIRWFNGDDGVSDRIVYDRVLTDGTVGTADHQDAHTVNADLTGFFFEKTVANLASGANPATTAAPGDTLRYTLRFRTTDDSLTNFSIVDEPDALNVSPVFVPGTLSLVTVPAGADTSGTSAIGGAAGTGVIDVRNLSTPTGGEVVIEFDITLAATIPDGTIATNQASLFDSGGSLVAPSDDPFVNGAASPDVAGDEDPTRITIVSSPAFEVQKISADLTGDPAVLLAGETLRYTITVRNVGDAEAVDAVLRDAVPVNTSYVPGSTTLNGAPVADIGGLSPLVNGMPINTPADPTPGTMPADPAAVATITFDVIVDPGVLDGTIISNQGFVSAVQGGVVDQPSDDPTTPIADDPTQDVVGNLPLIYAEKSVQLFGDLGTPGIVDPGDVLRYTIVVQNSAAIDATGIVLTDNVPADTSYVADTTLLDGTPYGQPDGGVFPLIAGVSIGTLAANSAATVQFDLRVAAGTPTGTVISNQATVSSTELPDVLTDGDGDPTTGPEPTVVVVGDVQQLAITKQVAVVGGGPAVPGAELEYLVRVTNIGAVPALGVVITDDLDAPQPGQLAYVPGSATMNGATAGVSFSGSTITADYASARGELAPGEVVTLRFRTILDPGLVQGTTVTNTGVVTWNNPIRNASASVSFVVGGIPGVSTVNGSVWHDANFDDVRDAGERRLGGWSVELYRDGVRVLTVPTDVDGDWRIVGLDPNQGTGIAYEVRFLAPGAGPSSAALGDADSAFTDGMHRISDIVVPPDATLQGLNLPIDPNGVVYNSLSRVPVPGVTLTLLDAGSGTPLPGACFDDPAQQGQVTLPDGYYKFDLNFGDSACPSGAEYLLDVRAPASSGTFVGASQIIPPTSGAATAAFVVPTCPGSIDDTVPATAQFCEVQPSEFAPGAAVPPRTTGTNYHLRLMFDGTRAPGSSQIFNNHVPVDPVLGGTLALTKTSPLRTVTRGQQVPYRIVLNNLSGSLLTDADVVDTIPPGFVYVEGSALLDGVPAEPTVLGRELRWNGLTIAGLETRTFDLLLTVGAGVGDGSFVNRVTVVNAFSGTQISGEATATVRVVPDPTFDCTDVIGRVFDDVDRNGIQDEGELGIAGVRVVTPRGLRATTDEHGRYHITCAIVPNENRGSTFVLKLDDRTLPSGFRLTTDAVQVKRATRGKALRIAFGATIHRVVGIDLSDAAFEPDATEVRVQWRPRIERLLDELRKAPSLLRLSYVADTEELRLVERRMEAIHRRVTEAWEASGTPYPLTIEPEIFWRLGGPPERSVVRSKGGR